MPENPLLPHRRLREMYALMLRCRTLLRGRGRGRNVAAMEAVLAATTLHLQPGDLLCCTSGDGEQLFMELAPPTRGGVVGGGLATIPTPASPLMTAAAIACGLLDDERTNKQAVALVFLRNTGRSPEWKQALTWAQAQTLPLIVVVTDTSAQSSRTANHPETPSWAALSRLARSLEMPVVTVDGLDAVALYRVMQETVVRARYAGGPAIIWAILGGVPSKSADTHPVSRLRRYMKVRNIAL